MHAATSRDLEMTEGILTTRESREVDERAVKPAALVFPVIVGGLGRTMGFI